MNKLIMEMNTGLVYSYILQSYNCSLYDIISLVLLFCMGVKLGRSG